MQARLWSYFFYKYCQKREVFSSPEIFVFSLMKTNYLALAIYILSSRGCSLTMTLTLFPAVNVSKTYCLDIYDNLFLVAIWLGWKNKNSLRILSKNIWKAHRIRVWSQILPSWLDRSSYFITPGKLIVMFN